MRRRAGTETLENATHVGRERRGKEFIVERDVPLLGGDANCTRRARVLRPRRGRGRGHGGNRLRVRDEQSLELKCVAHFGPSDAAEGKRGGLVCELGILALGAALVCESTGDSLLSFVREGAGSQDAASTRPHRPHRPSAPLHAVRAVTQVVRPEPGFGGWAVVPSWARRRGIVRFGAGSGKCEQENWGGISDHGPAREQSTCLVNPFGTPLALTFEMWKHLLVPIDFSDCAARALDLALALAERDRAKLTLVHVSPLPPNLRPDALVMPAGATERLRVDDYTTRGVRERLDVLAAPLRERGFDVHTLAVAAPSGDVASELLCVLTDVGADAVVVGTHGRSGLSHLLLGSVAENVIRRATVPVITVRSRSPEAEPTREERVAEDELAG